MKFLTIQTIEQGRVPPRARIGLYRVVDTIVEDCPIQYVVALRFPFTRWKDYFSIRTLDHDQGWCVYTCYLSYNKWTRTFKRGGMWVPIETDDL